MYDMKNKVSFFLLASILGLVPLRSQSPVPIQSKFRTIGLDVNRMDLFYSLKNSDVPVSVTSDTRSDFYEIPAANPVIFYKIQKSTNNDIVRIPVAQVDLSPGGALPMVAFSKDSMHADALKLRVLRDDLSAFPIGSFKILNGGLTPMEAVFSGKATALPPASEVIVTPKPEAGKPTLYFQLNRMGTNGVQTIYANNWVYSPSVRTMVVISPASSSGSFPTVRRLGEIGDILYQVPKVK